MKMSKQESRNVGCLYLLVWFALIILQAIFLTLKCAGIIDWSWWAILVPAILVFGVPLAVLIAVAIVAIPIAVWKVWKNTKRLDAEAAKYGMERRPGERNSDLKKRIVRRNMVVGNYSRKDIKDMILDKYPAVGSCMISVNHHTKSITLVLRREYVAEPGAGFTDDELIEISCFAAKYIPEGYTVSARNA